MYIFLCRLSISLAITYFENTNKEHKQFITLLLKRKDININIQNEIGNTPMHLAVNNPFTDIVKELLKFKDINVNIQNNYGYTPMHLLFINKNVG